MNQTPKNGDRVRVVVEGVVAQWDSKERTDQWVRDANGVNLGWLTFNGALPSGVVSVEVLPPPEPEWRPGDVAVCDHGETYFRADDGWLTKYGDTAVFGDCPRTLIVRDGKPVSP